MEFKSRTHDFYLKCFKNPNKNAKPLSNSNYRDCFEKKSTLSNGHRDETFLQKPGSKQNYIIGRLLGNGSFGYVYEATFIHTQERVAIKKIYQDPKKRNRELDVMKELCHPNTISLKDYFFTEMNSNDIEIEISENKINSQTPHYLYIVMDYFPETIYTALKNFTRINEYFPLHLIRLYMYQICRSLGYLHSIGICHRDIKPQNVLISSLTHSVKLCDFGSAKRLTADEPSVAYICSRYYRAPELMLGSRNYTTAIDIWSLGCVLGELIIGKPVFNGTSSVNQLIKIIQVLGTPTPKEIKCMNPKYSNYTFPIIVKKTWNQYMVNYLGPNTSVYQDALDLMNCFIRYDPNERLKPYEALNHPFFKPLREESEQELSMMTPETRFNAVPYWITERHKLPTKLENRGFSDASTDCEFQETPIITKKFSDAIS